VTINTRDIYLGEHDTLKSRMRLGRTSRSAPPMIEFSQPETRFEY